MNLPEIGKTITTDAALDLCKHFNLNYLSKRIELNKNNYKEWIFDGCSCVHDKFLGLIAGCNSDDITYKCCLPHDLAYAYGDLGNHVERKRVDLKFLNDLIIKVEMEEWIATAIYQGVRIGGGEIFGLTFSWGFASKQTKISF